MKHLKTGVLAAALALASLAANATTFDFVYTFADGQAITGSFQGVTTDSGQSVIDVSNFVAELDGVAFAPVTTGGVTYGNSTLQANAWNPSLLSFDDTTPVTIYANGALNNWAISDVDAATNSSPDYEFAYINDATNGIYETVAANFLQSNGQGATQLALDAPGAASQWTLTEVAPVPEPTDLSLLLSGFAVLGFVARRRLAA